jgi:hypothetical protein
MRVIEKRSPTAAVALPSSICPIYL